MAYSQADYDRLAGSMGTVATKQFSFHGMLYGPKGSAKTVTAAEIMAAILPKGKGALHIDIGEGWVSLKNHPSISKKILTIPFTDLDDINTMVDLIEAKQGKFKNIGGIILDEGSSMSEIETDRQFESRQAGGRGVKAISDSTVPEWPDYSASLVAFRVMLRRIFDLPDMHVIVIAHEATDKAKNGAIIKYRPSFSPKIGQKVGELMHLVARLSAVAAPDPAGGVKYTREAQVHPTGLYDAKTRLPFDNAKIPTADLAPAIAEWLDAGGELLEPSDPVVTTVRNDPEPVPEGVTPEQAIDLLDSDVDEDDSDLGAILAE